MKKKYSTPNLIKAVSLSAAMATLLSSVSPVFAANLAITGANNLSTNLGGVSYAHGSHGSVVLSGDDDYCGADNVIGRGGKQQKGITDSQRISAEDQYERFIGEKVFNGRQPYGTTTQKVIWQSEGILTNDATYMGTNTNGFQNAMPEAYGVYSFATGCGSAATGNYSTVFGAGATAKAGGAQAFGVSALAGGIASVAMGVGSEAAGKSAVAIGGLANALGENSIALGTKVKAAQSYAIAIGTDAEARASGSIAIGSRRSNRTEENKPNREVLAEAENSIAIGTFAYAKTEDSVALGVNAQVFSKDGVAIGGGSVSRREKGAEAYDPATDTVSSEKSGLAWKSTAGVFSIGEVNADGNDGKGELTRQITGVAAGKEDTDAVNVAQLKALRGIIGKGGGGGWKISANNTGPTDVNVGNTVDFSVIKSNVGPDNLKITKSNENDNHKIQFTLADELKLTKVTTGQSSMSDDGFIIGNDGPKMVLDGFFVNGQNGPSMTQEGIDAGNKKITNVAEAENDTDAVNFEQLKKFTEGIKGGGWKLSVEDGKATDITAGSTVRFFAVSNNYTGQKNIKIANTNGQNVSFDLANNINVESVTAGESIMDASGFRFEGDDGTEGPSITVNGIYAGDKTITGVATGEQDTDAVNFGQLKKYVEKNGGSWKLSVDGNNATDVKAGGTVNLVAAEGNGGHKNIQIEKDDNNKVTFSLNDNLKLTSVTTGNSKISSEGFEFIDGDGPKITLKGIDAGNKKITSVSDGTDNTDAVNYKQLKDVQKIAENGWKLSVDGKNATTVKAGSTVDLVAGENANGSNKNIQIEKDDNNKVTFTLNDDLKLTSVTTGNSKISSKGFEFIDGEGPKITLDGINAGSKKITNVLEGDDDTDAVNYKQLKEMKNQIVGGSLVKWDDGKKLITIGAQKGGMEINIAGTEGERTIAGVKDGKISKESYEAINGSQINTISGKIAKFFGGGTSFENGKFTGPEYELKTIEEDGTIAIKKYGDVGSALDAVNTNVFAVDHRITVGFLDIADYFGGGAKYEKGKWHTPTFKVSEREENGTIVKKEYHNVADAFGGVNNSITDIYTQINNVTNDSLVKWDEDKQLITVGVKKGGTKIDITGTDGERIIGGVKDGDISQSSKEAVNGSQLWKTNENVKGFEKDIKYFRTIVDATSNAIIDIGEEVYNLSQDALLWNEKEGAFVARHGTDGEKTESKIKFLAAGEISKDSMEAINGSQINKISGDIAKFFGGDAAFENGAFVGPQYNLSTVSTDGSTKQKTFSNVGDALEGLDVNVKNVNSRIKYVDQKFDDKFDKLSQDALLWSKKDQAFVARHGTDGQKTDSKITSLLNGDISEASTDAINGSQLYTMGDKIANYFGGGASYKDGEWTAPTFKVSQRVENGNIVEKKYNNVAKAFEGVDTSITDIYNQINNVTENSLVKWDEGEKLITIGKEKGGKKISIENMNGEDRTLSGVKDGIISRTSTEAVNGSQLFKTDEKVTTVTNNLEKVAKNTKKYFGGSTDVLEGIEPTFFIQGTIYRNVTDAFTGVNSSITNIDNKISDLKENSLVKWDERQKLITIGKDKAGTEINIAGYAGVARKISGVQAAENGDEAVNKDQLDKSIQKISKDIETASAAAVLYDKDEEGNVNYESVTLGGDKNNGSVALRNVKNGDISQDSTDAINGSQIHSMGSDIAKFFGGGAKFVNGAFEGLKYTLSAIVDGTVGKANFYDVGSALTGLDKNVQDVNKRLTNVSNKFDQKIEGISKDALLWSEEDNAFVARHEKNGKKTNSKLKYLLDGEIADGSTDAITGNQLYFMSNKLANYFGGGAKYENGKWTDPTFKIVQVNADGTTVEKKHNNVADAFGDVNKNMSNINNRIDDVINKVDSDALKWNSDKKAYDATHDGTPSKIINVADGKIEKGSKDAVNGGQLWQTNERVANVENRVTDVENHVEIIDKKVDNISNTIEDIGDTVNNINIKVDNIDNKVNDIAEDAVRYDRDENGKKTNKITLAGGDASEPVVIDNVADGKIEKGSKEAVNGGQLHDYTQEQMKIVLDESKQYTDQKINNIRIDAIDEAVDKSKQYTDMKFDALNYSIENVKKEARQAAAIGLAVSNLRYNDTPGKLSVGFGTGLWRSQSAFAFGAGYTSENGNIRSNVSVTTSGGHWGVGAGFNMTLN